VSAVLQGRIALVTGASSGLGRHFARLLAGHGAAVALAARRTDALEELAEEIASAGGRACPVAMDVTDEASVENAMDAIAGTLGVPTVLINNAGTVAAKAALDIEGADWDAVIDTNLKGAWTVARATAKRMIAAESGGAIVNIASILAFGVSPGVMPYAVSKAGLVQMTRALALEWARHGIRVNALAPGYIETDFNREYLNGDAGRAMIKGIPQRRAGRMEDLDGPLLLLTSDASGYMTGAVLPVDGGHLVRSL